MRVTTGLAATLCLVGLPRPFAAGGWMDLPFKLDGPFAGEAYVELVNYRVFAPIQLPAEPAEVHLFIGLGGGGDPSDGVDYSMLVIEAAGKTTKLFTEHGDQKVWREVTADLAAVAGQKVQFKLICACGKQDNTSADWACWGDPVIRLKQPVPELTLAHRD